MIKSFKQFLTESKIELGHGLYTYDDDNLLYGTVEGYNYVKTYWGILFNTDEQPRNKSYNDSDYFSIQFSTLINKLTVMKSLFIQSNQTLEVEFYRFIEPETRKEMVKIFTKAEHSLPISLDDKNILKYMPAKNLYLYPDAGKKSSYDDSNDDYLKSKHKI